MYDSKVFFKFIEQAGFEIKAIHDLLGHSHTLLVLQKKYYKYYYLRLR